MHLIQSWNAQSQTRVRMPPKLPFSYGICIKHYHAGDNERFTENVWMKAVSDASQMITFCGIGARFDRAHTYYAHTRDTSVATSSKCPPVALRAVPSKSLAKWLRSVPWSKGDFPRSNNFPESQTPCWRSNMSTHLVAPAMYVLNEKLQGQKPHGKWKERAHVGVYLGHSPPRHSSTVTYVLNMTTGHMSAQFHLVFDDHFDTILTTKTMSQSLCKTCQIYLIRNPTSHLRHLWLTLHLIYQGASKLHGIIQIGMSPRMFW